jgi:hypothetical protein
MTLRVRIKLSPEAICLVVEDLRRFKGITPQRRLGLGGKEKPRDRIKKELRLLIGEKCEGPWRVYVLDLALSQTSCLFKNFVSVKMNMTGDLRMSGPLLKPANPSLRLPRPGAYSVYHRSAIFF